MTDSTKAFLLGVLAGLFVGINVWAISTVLRLP